MTAPDLDKLKARIQALGAKTVDNGCTEAEALAAAAKVADLLQRYDLTLDEVTIARTRCQRAVYVSGRNKRIPLDACIDAIARFCDCQGWRERDAAGEPAYVFFGLPADAAAAVYLAGLVDATVRAELGRYKTSPAYRRFHYGERALANSSFALGMIDTFAHKLVAMKDERNTVRNRDHNDAAGRRDHNDAAGRRDLRAVALAKTAAVARELAALGINLVAAAGSSRLVSPEAFDAGIAAGHELPIPTDPRAPGSSRDRS